MTEPLYRQPLYPVPPHAPLPGVFTSKHFLEIHTREVIPIGANGTPNPLTSLDPEQLTCHPGQHTPSVAVFMPLADASATDFRHSGWAHQRQRTYKALLAADIGTTKLRRFATCGASAWVEESDDERPEYRIVCQTCNSRWCLPCNHARGLRIADSIREAIRHTDVRLLTLTVRSRTDSLEAACDHLYASFLRLRKTAIWREHMGGGVAVLEVTYNDQTCRWHPHLHVLVEGRFVPQKDLSAAWHKASGDSFVLDIRLVTDPEHAGKYVAKYITKPVPPNVLRNHEALVAAIQAFARRRTVLWFGGWRAPKAEPPENDGRTWSRYCSFKVLLERAIGNDKTALRILTALHRQLPIAEQGP